MVAPGGMRGCSGGACMVAPRGAYVVAPGGCAWLLRGGMHGFFDEIRSMSGRYASYWNAFLLSLILRSLHCMVICFNRYYYSPKIQPTERNEEPEILAL